MAEEKSVNGESPSELEIAKGKMEEYFEKVVELLNREVNIATRYELKVRVETIQDLFKHMFGE